MSLAKALHSRPLFVKCSLLHRTLAGTEKTVRSMASAVFLQPDFIQTRHPSLDHACAKQVEPSLITRQCLQHILVYIYEPNSGFTARSVGLKKRLHQELIRVPEALLVWAIPAKITISNFQSWIGARFSVSTERCTAKRHEQKSTSMQP